MTRVYKASFLLSRKDLITAITLKLETTNNHYSDIFIVTAKAFGNKIKTKGVGRPKKDLPKASFSQMSSFLGAM